MLGQGLGCHLLEHVRGVVGEAELEERIEALVVAYVGACLGQLGPDACAFLGDLQKGYILLPDPSRAQPAQEEPAT